MSESPIPNARAVAGQNDATGRDPGSPEISAIITCYFEEDTLDEFHERLSSALHASGRSYEIVIVNDGSTDGTFEKIEAIYERDPMVSVAIDFFKNAGQLRAWTAGICHARGDVVLLIDSDLQLDPGELPSLLAEWDKGYDVVSGYRADRTESIFRVLPSKIANMIMRKVSRTDLSDFGCTFKLYDARLLRGFELGPFKPFLTASILSHAGSWKEVPVTQVARSHGRSGWTFGKLWEFNMDNIALLLSRPFQIMAGVAGGVAMLLGLRLILELFTEIRILSSVSNGLLLNAIVISGLITIAALSLVGEFGIRSFRSSMQLPGYIIRSKLERHSPSDERAPS